MENLENENPSLSLDSTANKENVQPTYSENNNNEEEEELILVEEDNDDGESLLCTSIELQLKIANNKFEREKDTNKFEEEEEKLLNNKSEVKEQFEKPSLSSSSSTSIVCFISREGKLNDTSYKIKITKKILLPSCRYDGEEFDERDNEPINSLSRSIFRGYKPNFTCPPGKNWSSGKCRRIIK